MKNKFKYLITTSFIFFFSTTFTYAFSCKQDIEQMDIQIKKFHSIKSTDEHLFNGIFYTFETKDFCFGQGYYFKDHGDEPRDRICGVRWTRGDWGNTLTCYAP